MKFLIIGEAVCLAHVVRPLKISQALLELGHDVCFATDIREFGKIIPIKSDLRFRPLPSIDSRQFLARNHNMLKSYTTRDIENYLLNDRKIIDIEKPDCIIHDFRISMNLQRGAGPCIFPIVDAYWATVPSEVFTLPPPQPGIVAKIAYQFPTSLRGIFGYFVDRIGASPFDNAARSIGVRPLHRLSKYLLSGDHILLAASAEMFPAIKPEANHTFLGHIEWKPDSELCESIDDLEYDIFLSLGSSGPSEQIPVILKWLAELNFRTLLCAGTKHDLGEYTSGQTHVRRFVDGKDAAQRARVTICNGGSPSVYQALSAGCPVLGITSNFDQALCMRAFSNQEYVKSVPLALLNRERFISNLTSLIDGQNRSMIKSTLPYSDIKTNLSKFVSSITNEHHPG
jgi:UDP:flavonoid glycosyltransferase YjiC (YdhE family)